MKIFTKRDKRTNLEKEIDTVLECMWDVEPDSEEYTAMANNLVKLLDAQSKQKSRGINKDTVAIIVGNLLGIGLILGYEKLNVITSKAVGFVIKGRV